MNLLQKLILGFLTTLLFSNYGVFAAGIDQFKVEFNPTNAKVGEAIDLTIEAVDKDNNTVIDYDGTILIFSESDPDAVLPSVLDDNTYIFSPADQGKIKFENSIIFKESGLQNISIYDLNDDTIYGIAEITINKSDESLVNTNINIVSPQQGLTIGKNSILISGTTTKNHQVKIIVNSNDEFFTTSNNDGIFEKTIDNLNEGDNIFLTQILDSDGNVIGESDKVSIKIELNNLSIKNVSITPEKVNPEDKFIIEVLSEPGLNSVSAIINDVVTVLKESENGIYKSEIYAPKTPGVFKIDIKIVNELGHEKIELGSSSITVNEIELKSAKEDKQVDDSKITGLEISGLKLIELKSKSVLSWDKVEKANSYNVYKKITDGKLELIENVTAPKFEIEIVGDNIKYDYFAVKAVVKNSSGEIYEGSLSDATKVKTGPELLIILLLSLMIGGFFLFKKQKI